MKTQTLNNNFYSFLQGQSCNSALLDETLLDSVMQKAANSREVQQKYIYLTFAISNPTERKECELYL